MTRLVINGVTREVKADKDTPILWVLREDLNLTGTKYGCGVGQCGSCTIHINGEPVRSCSMTFGELKAGTKITTIEGLSPTSSHPVQKAWLELDVPQCGYCQSGMIMAVSALLKKIPNPTDEQINAEITNICRCGTYNRVRAGIKLAAGMKA